MLVSLDSERILRVLSQSENVGGGGGMWCPILDQSMPSAVVSGSFWPIVIYNDRLVYVPCQVLVNPPHYSRISPVHSSRTLSLTL